MATERADVEPSVLDWFISLVRLRPIPIPEPGSQSVAAPPASTETVAPTDWENIRIRARAAHVRVPAALFLAFVAQVGIGSHRNVGLFVGLYLVAAVLVGWAVWAGDFGVVVRPRTPRKSTAATYDWRWLLAGLGLAVLSYLTASENTFRLTTLIFWIASVVATGRAFWLGRLPSTQLRARIRRFLSKPQLQLRLDGWSLLVVAVFGVAAYFRFVHLAEVPYGMWSDHAEKYLDIVELLNGETSVFFTRNTGREPAQFYLTAVAIKWFGADFSFLTLKSITALAGLLTLPYIYLFGREVGGRKVGLFAMFMAGIAIWPNLVARIGLRHVFHIFFVAPALYYMVRGFKERRQNDFVVTGILVGLSIYGYTAARIIPLVIVLGLALYLAHRVARGHRVQSLLWIGIAALLAIVVAAPFLRVTLDLQDDVLYRSLTRVSGSERALPGEPLQLFFGNMWNALRMFVWDSGQIWILSLPGQPALDWVIGAFFHLGLVVVIVRYVKGRDWVNLFLVLSIPILLLPSVLSLAFPSENPHPSRAGGAILPVFTIAGIAMAALWIWSKRNFSAPWSGRIGTALIGGMFLVSALTNYDLTIRQYGDMQRRGSWNTAEAAEVVSGFMASLGSIENVHMIAYPHWMDSRLVTLMAGRPGGDIVLWPEEIDSLDGADTPRLFLLHHADGENLDRLRTRFPDGVLNRHTSKVEGRDFVTYLVLGGEL